MSDDLLLTTPMLGVVEGKAEPGRLAWKWIDDILVWCGQDVKGAMMTTEDRKTNGEHSWLAAMVHANY